MIHGKIRSFKGRGYIKKDHFCPDCKTKLEPVTIRKVVNSKSPEAKQYDFTLIHGTHLVGNVEFSWTELKCPSCFRQIKIDEMQQIELNKMDDNQLKKQEKKEKLQVALFKFFLFAFALILIICVFMR